LPIGQLPDKTMFASLVMATKGRPGHVWGDLTQILTANLVARYHSGLSVAIGSILAPWAVAALAVASGQTLVRFVNISTIRRFTGVALLILASYTAWSAAH
jgi:putative Ca2+/H+ antiporter (TMEM165/GDT1 family)